MHRTKRTPVLLARLPTAVAVAPGASEKEGPSAPLPSRSPRTRRSPAPQGVTGPLGTCPTLSELGRGIVRTAVGHLIITPTISVLSTFVEKRRGVAR
ncbi:hypothetical protein ACIGBL_06285 [Streptomyces sp. NPDC085614]|uniref:hypothetical protein n=1 Tax=Streptomyces sp. NPDC085614 TaxID=3365733 RepID=UPI0037CD46C4